jgi:hypothetical protein
VFSVVELTLQRDDATATRTIGHLFVGMSYQCFTLEDTIRGDGPKMLHETAIPAGRYQVMITHSQRFERMLPLLVGVPDFDGIRIHAGNTDKDTSGCILVGMSRARDSILSSQSALAALQPKIAAAIAQGEGCWITILNPIPQGTLRA